MTKRILEKVRVENMEEIIEKTLRHQVQSGALYKHSGKSSLEFNYSGLSKAIAEAITQEKTIE